MGIWLVDGLYYPDLYLWAYTRVSLTDELVPFMKILFLKSTTSPPVLFFHWAFQSDKSETRAYWSKEGSATLLTLLPYSSLPALTQPGMITDCYMTFKTGWQCLSSIRKHILKFIEIHRISVIGISTPFFLLLTDATEIRDNVLALWPEGHVKEDHSPAFPSSIQTQRIVYCLQKGYFLSSMYHVDGGKKGDPGSLRHD